MILFNDRATGLEEIKTAYIQMRRVLGISREIKIAVPFLFLMTREKCQCV